MAEVTASYAVHAGTTATVDLEDVSDPDMIALYLMEDAAEVTDVAVCNSCANQLIDPEAKELVGFTVAGVSYARDTETGHWVAVGGDHRG